MRTLSLLLPAAILVLACGAGAQPLPYPQLNATPTSTVQVRAPLKAAYITDVQAEQIDGSYALSNGWRMKVRTQPHYIDATIDKQKPMRLYAATTDRFVSRDGNVTMQFLQGESGDDMTMSYVPDARLAQVVVISSRLAQR